MTLLLLDRLPRLLADDTAAVLGSVAGVIISSFCRGDCISPLLCCPTATDSATQRHHVGLSLLLPCDIQSRVWVHALHQLITHNGFLTLNVLVTKTQWILGFILLILIVTTSNVRTHQHLHP